MPALVGLTGDVMSHVGFVISEIEGSSFDSYFSSAVRKLCLSQDEMWGNLEGPAAKQDDGLVTYLQMKEKASRWPKLFFPRSYLGTLYGLNFRFLGIANNHSFDFETPEDTRITSELVQNAGITAGGLCFSPIYRGIDDISFAIIATTNFLNKPQNAGEIALVTERTLEELLSTIRRARREVDYVVVMTHWGWDYLPAPTSRVRELTDALFDAGAKIIVGNHPHILWPIECRAEDRIVTYSLGNFSQVFGCGRTHPNYSIYRKALHSGILSLEIERQRLRPTFHPTIVRQNYEEWIELAAQGKSYWHWELDDLARWSGSLAGRNVRLTSTVELCDRPIAGNLSTAAIATLQTRGIIEPGDDHAESVKH